MRGQLYVDDPCFSMLGNTVEHDRWAAIVVLVWRLLGFPVAFDKARRGSCVVWIGAVLSFLKSHLTVSIPVEKADELAALISEARRSNVVPVRMLRRLAGLACHFATLIYVWRPFLSELWAAIQSFENDLSSRAPGTASG